MPLSEQLLRSLRAAMPAGRLLTARSQLAAYAADAVGHKPFPPDAVAIPEDAREVGALVRVLHGSAVPFQVRGAGTSLAGGPVAVQGGVTLHLSRLNRIEEIDAADGYAVVEPGVVLDRLNEAVAPLGLHYPPDPSTGPVCTLGGNVATNAGGVHCFRYGVTGNYVLGVEAILPDGTTVRWGGPAGGRGDWRDDWKRLFIGSEGTLGILTRLWLRLIPRPEKVWTFRATYPGFEQAGEAIRHLARHPAYPAAIEFMDPRCVEIVENSALRVGLPRGCYMILTEIDGPPPLVDGRVAAIARLLAACGSGDVTYSDRPDERLGLWKARKAMGGLFGKIRPNYVVQDAVIPKAGLGEMLRFIYELADREGVPAATLLHAGDGNLHPNFLFDARVAAEVEKVELIGKRLMHKVSEMGGTLSGEHGIGNDKAAYTAGHFGPLGEALQMSIPRLFNPRHQLNPLKVFPARRFG